MLPFTMRTAGMALLTLSLAGGVAGAQDRSSSAPAATRPTTAPTTAPQAPTTGPQANVRITDSGLIIAELAPGRGERTSKDGDRVSVHYVGRLQDGTVFDSSLERNKPIDFVLGRGKVIKGWDEGISGMRVGQRRRLVIPPELAYKERGSGIIPPNATLTFEVELVAIR